jgi:GNAT superfamily N-acetyltransferase
VAAEVDPALLAADLAPGDREVARRDWTDLTVHRVRGAGDPELAPAWERLWAEFGRKGGMETLPVIRARLAWEPGRPVGGAALLYELLVLRRGGAVAALRDHSAVVRLDAADRPRPGPVVVHLSHALVEPAHRGSGLAGWLRALPLQAARRCAAVAGCPSDTPIVLAAEMEAPDPGDPARAARLRSYARAGFRKVDPAVARYAQPDFRPPEVLAHSAPRPLPLDLVVRRVGREDEGRMPAPEVAAVVEAIYAVYAVHVPAAALDPLRADAARWASSQASFRLLPPLA